jgi:hypothetical protein
MPGILGNAPATAEEEAALVREIQKLIGAKKLPVKLVDQAGQPVALKPDVPCTLCPCIFVICISQ